MRTWGTRVHFIGNAGSPDKIRAGGRVLDMRIGRDRAALADILRLSPAQARAVSETLEGAGSNARDELAQLTIVWAQAENARVRSSRMVISGHHVGGNVFWGDSNGSLTLNDLKRLAAAFPHATAAIEDVHLSACYSASGIGQWRTFLSGLTTVWAYSGSAPGSHSGAVAHLRIWDRATKARRNLIDRTRAHSTRKGQNVAVWSRVYGLQTAVIETIEEVRARLVAAEGTFRAFYEGTLVVTDTDAGPLRDYYNDVQAMLQHDDLPVAERPGLERKRETTIRLIYYNKSVKNRFAQHYRAEVTSGFRSWG